MYSAAKTVGFLRSLLRLLDYILPLLHSSGHITHSSLVKIPQYTRIINYEMVNVKQ